MEAKILSKSDEKKWDNFLINHPLSSIFQTSNWGHFQEKIPYRGKCWIIALYDNGKIVGGTLLVLQKMAKGYSWLYSPRGPILDYQNPQIAKIQMEALLNIIKKIAKEEKSVFYRIDPLLLPKEFSETSDTALPSFSKTPATNFKSFKQNCHSHQPENTLLLDLSLSENELLEQMKPKGRYNISLADRKGVKIKIISFNDENFSRYFDDFYALLKDTTLRDKFSGHPKEFYLNMLDILKGNARLYIAEYENETLAGLIGTFYKDTFIYYYGSSSNSHRNLMAPYLLQWTAIKDAKKMGAKYYDFLGIAPENAKNHPWSGVTDFKLKFGGIRVSYLKAQEYVFKKIFYKAYHLVKKIKN